MQILDTKENFHGIQQKYWIKCPYCHSITQMRGDVILKGSWCQNCRRERINKIIHSKLKTTDQFQQELNKVNPNLKILSNYEGSHKKVQYLCLQCNTIHCATPTNLLSGYGCPVCKVSSIGESLVRDFLLKNNIIFEEQKTFPGCRDQLPLRFDFFLPKYNLVIEVQGEQHYRIGYH